MKDSIGTVKTELVNIPLPADGLKLENGGILSELDVAYETYGNLSPSGDNAVYICHALTGDAHAAGYYDKNEGKPGWWDQMIGPGKGIDTNFYYVICANILGGCAGTTGPTSINPETGKPYGSSFPAITVDDIVMVQKLLLDHLGIKHLAAVIGGSFGGMQVLGWAIDYPDFVDHCICIASGASLSAQALAFDAVACEAIYTDPNWAAGNYYENHQHPDTGLALARKIGHITYLSPEIMEKKFGRERINSGGQYDHKHRFQVESYLAHQGRKLVERFDANSYVRITEAMDEFDLKQKFGSINNALGKIKSKFLVVALSSDWLFPPEQSRELAYALLRSGKQVSYCLLEAPYGHDAFLLDIDELADAVRAFLPWVTPTDSSPTPQTDYQELVERTIFKVTSNIVKQGSKVLDLGCGDGDLLSLLKTQNRSNGLGMDISLDNIIKTIDKGHNALQKDIDKGLSEIADQCYDYAIIANTLQQIKKPKLVLKEMTRVARECIVAFPNFGNWQNRLFLFSKGRMPKSSVLPYEWYDTPNIHLTTRNDFIDLCKSLNIEILGMTCIPETIVDRFFVSIGKCSLGAQRIVARIRRSDDQHKSNFGCEQATLDS